MALIWYWRIYGADPNDPISYVSIGPTPPRCPGSVNVCAIYAQDDGLGSPIIDVFLQNQIETALITGNDQPRVLLRFLN